MGLGLPDGGHLTHGYYVSLTFGVPPHDDATKSNADCQKEDDGFFHLLPVLPLRYP